MTLSTMTYGTFLYEEAVSGKNTKLSGTYMYHGEMLCYLIIIKSGQAASETRQPLEYSGMISAFAQSLLNATLYV